MIRVETSKKNAIRNHQDFDIKQVHINFHQLLVAQYPDATPRTGPSLVYNCHGLTFASRRTRIEKTPAINLIIGDDEWEEIVETKDLLPGDVVVYFSDKGEANHSGVVVECSAPLHLPIICSKWGSAGEFVHKITDGPGPPLYGPVKKYYRCRL